MKAWHALAIAMVLAGCQDAAARARVGANTAAYTSELDACITSSLNYAMYKTCADGVDFKYRVQDAQTSKDGGQ